MRDLEPQVFLCSCESNEHQIIARYDKDDNLVYLSIHLINYNSFWKRLLNGIKYIFGYRSQYGHWDEFIVNFQDAEKIQIIVDLLKQKNKISSKHSEG